VTEFLLTLAVVLGLLNAVLLILSFKRGSVQTRGELQTHFANLQTGLERIERQSKEDTASSRSEGAVQARQLREELSHSLKSAADSLANRQMESATLQLNQLEMFANQLGALTKTNEEKLERVRETIEQRLKSLQDDNSAKLEQMRATVDEKLHATLEKRLGDSFKLVSERLELVHRGLGEMQTLAAGVGDLKKVLTNVKTRGTWGEIQLAALLEQLLTRDQYGTNVKTKQGSNACVEFAIRLPGRDASAGSEVWLPIDAKYPVADYQRLLEAQEQVDVELVKEVTRDLEKSIKLMAADIKEKYLDPPHTTDFAIMFLPSEGLYAEVLRRPGLSELLQGEYRVVLAGPTTLAALLNSLQMGFRTLAIEKRSTEVWALLSQVKTEFGRFGDYLDATKKKLEEASHKLDEAAVRSRAIERKLRDVQELPAAGAQPLLEDPVQWE
jgi:DNA recombination protein RmuC